LAASEIVDLKERRESDINVITFYVGMGIRGPIAEGDYNVGDAKINLSYLQKIKIDTLPGPIDLPRA